MLEREGEEGSPVTSAARDLRQRELPFQPHPELASISTNEHHVECLRNRLMPALSWACVGGVAVRCHVDHPVQALDLRTGVLINNPGKDNLSRRVRACWPLRFCPLPSDRWISARV